MTADLERFLRVILPTAGLSVPLRQEGKYLQFLLSSRMLCANNIWNVRSRAGGFEVGTVEWSNQWGTWSFRMHPEAKFNIECVREVYAFLKGIGAQR